MTPYQQDFYVQMTAVQRMLLAEHGGLPGVRDEGLLDSALNRPQQHFAFSNEVSIFDLAAAFCYDLAKNRPFIDGNKRVALTVDALLPNSTDTLSMRRSLRPS